MKFLFSGAEVAVKYYIIKNKSDERKTGTVFLKLCRFKKLLWLPVLQPGT